MEVTPSARKHGVGAADIQQNLSTIVDIYRIENGYLVEHWDVMQDVIEGGPNPNSPF